MKIICDCGKTMSLDLFEPDQTESYVGFNCSNCGASFYGTLKAGEKDNEKSTD